MADSLILPLGYTPAMDAKVLQWDTEPEDHPIALLHRHKVLGEKMLAAKIFLEKGCTVPIHHHESEQIAIIVSGKTRWTLGPEANRREIEAGAGEVLVLPGYVPHGVVALEDTYIYDILSPIGPMGVDTMSRG